MLSALGALGQLPDDTEPDGELLLGESLERFCDLAQADTALVHTMPDRIAGYRARFASLDDCNRPEEPLFRPTRSMVQSIG